MDFLRSKVNFDGILVVTQQVLAQSKLSFLLYKNPDVCNSPESFFIALGSF
jgi:hypothetical protein